MGAGGGMARAWFRALVRLYPEPFRRARGDDVVEHALADWREARRKGRGAGPAAALRLTWDLLAGALRLRLRPVRDRRGDSLAGREGRMGRVARDLRFAARALGRAPMYTTFVVLTLALGVGLDVAVFSVVNGVLVRPLEYAEADRLVYLTARLESDGFEHVLIAGGQLEDLRAGVPALDRVEGVAFVRQNLTGTDLPSQVRVGWSSPDFLSLLGVRPLHGRLYGPSDAPGSVVLGYGLWRDRFGADPEAIGRTVRLDGLVHTVVGVLPPDFRLRIPARRGRPEADLWKNPGTSWANGDIWGDRSLGMIQVVGRLAPGATLEAAQAGVDGVVAGLRDEIPALDDGGYAVAVAPLHHRVVEGVRTTLLVLLAAAATVLLVACANVAGLVLTRTQARSREVALRMALGASRAGVGSLVLAETLLLVVAGALLGVAVAAGALRAIAVLGADTVPLLDAVRPDARVFAFGLATVALTLAGVGLVPALRSASLDPACGLGDGRSTPGRSSARRAVVAVQMALSLVLLTAAGLLTSSLVRLHAVEPGVRTDDILTFSVSVPGARYGWPEGADRFYREVEAATAALPGVGSAGVVWPLPLSGANWSVTVRTPDAPADEGRYADYLLATEGAFATLEVPLVEGRLFGPDLDATRAVVVSGALAERLWPEGGSPIGRTLLADPWGRGPTEFEVVGVVGDVRHSDLREAPGEAAYFDSRAWSWVDWEVDVVARLDGGTPEEVIPAVRRAVAALDPEVPVADPVMLSELLGRQTAPVRFALGLLGAFAGVAVLLAMVGLYGVTAHTAGRRTREVGIRMALGSARGAVLRLFLREGLATVGAGLALGIVGALLVTRFLDAWLFGVEATDPATFALGAAALAGAAAVATWLPARRATRIDPVRALRAE